MNSNLWGVWKLEKYIIIEATDVERVHDYKFGLLTYTPQGFVTVILDNFYYFGKFRIIDSKTVSHDILASSDELYIGKSLIRWVSVTDDSLTLAGTVDGKGKRKVYWRRWE